LVWSRPPQLTSFPEVCITLLALGVTLLLCRLSWIYFERPFVQVGHRSHYLPAETLKLRTLEPLIVEGSES
jgi:hypothetical protein